jgi:anti-anti-sigma factor
MAEEQYHHLRTGIEQGVLVLTITEPRVQGDQIAEALRGEMLTALARSGLDRVVVDFRHAEYISSSAFRPLLAIRRKLQETAGQLVLCGLSGAVGDVFHTTRMIDDSGSAAPMFELEPDLAAAITRLNSGPKAD